MGRSRLDLGAASPSSPPQLHDDDELVARSGEVHRLDAEALPRVIESLLLAQDSFVAPVDVALGDLGALAPFDLGVHALQPCADPVAVDQLVAGAKRVERGIAVLGVEGREEPTEDLRGAFRCHARHATRLGGSSPSSTASTFSATRRAIPSRDRVVAEPMWGNSTQRGASSSSVGTSGSCS